MNFQINGVNTRKFSHQEIVLMLRLKKRKKERKKETKKERKKIKKRRYLLIDEIPPAAASMNNDVCDKLTREHR